MNQEIINLFDEYTHAPLSREEFLRRLTKVTGSLAAALAVLPMLEVNYAQAQTVPAQDDRITTEHITYPGDDCTMKGYLAKPKQKGKYGTVVVIHENRGLNPHIEDVTRRVALAGFLALAPDALSPLGGTPTNEDGGPQHVWEAGYAKEPEQFYQRHSIIPNRSTIPMAKRAVLVFAGAALWPISWPFMCLI